MAKIYRVYDVNKNEFVSTYTDKQQAIQRVDDICELNQTSGLFEVHEMDEDDATLASAVTVYKRHA